MKRQLSVQAALLLGLGFFIILWLKYERKEIVLFEQHGNKSTDRFLEKSQPQLAATRTLSSSSSMSVTFSMAPASSKRESEKSMAATQISSLTSSNSTRKVVPSVARATVFAKVKTNSPISPEKVASKSTRAPIASPAFTKLESEPPMAATQNSSLTSSNLTRKVVPSVARAATRNASLTSSNSTRKVVPTLVKAPIAFTKVIANATLSNKQATSEANAAETAPIALTTATNKPAMLAPTTTASSFQRLTGILKLFKQRPLTTFEQVEQLFPKPAVDDNDMIAIYSQKNRMKLRNMLNTRHVTLLVNGGSSMAGAGVYSLEDRCANVFARSFYNVSVVDRGHGIRNSFHSMQVMHSYIPEHVDLILWEFAVNDVFSYNSKDEMVARLEPRNQFILYLEQIRRVAKDRGQKPPLVIVMYLWNGPFSISSSRQIKQTVFDSHRHVGENFDFVVGHVNAANYIRSWPVVTEEAKAIALADSSHPNGRGHLILAYLMHDLVTNEQRREKPKEMNQTRPSFTWMCGNETKQKRLTRELLLKSRPVASFTAEVPKNEEQIQGMLSPKGAGNVTLESPHRNGRKQWWVPIPCCGIANITFDVSQYMPMKGVHINFSPDEEGAVVFFDRENVTDKLFHPKTWACLHCFWASQYGRYLVNWVVLPQWRNVSNVLMCNNLPTCGSDPIPENPLAVMSFSVYGRK